MSGQRISNYYEYEELDKITATYMKQRCFQSNKVAIINVTERISPSTKIKAHFQMLARKIPII